MQLNQYLKDSLVKPSGRNLKGIVTTIIESPSPANSKPHLSRRLQHGSDSRLSIFLNGMVHKPIRIPSINIKRLPVQHELRSVPLYKIYYGDYFSVPNPQISKRQVNESQTGCESKNRVKQPIPRHHYKQGDWKPKTQIEMIVKKKKTQCL